MKTVAWFLACGVIKKGNLSKTKDFSLGICYNVYKLNGGSYGKSN